MAREIKFRAWFNGLNIMGYVTNLKGSNTDFQFDGLVAECFIGGRQVFYEVYKNFVLMQFTGLKDKNGVEIYEGDVVRLMHSEHTHWNYEKFRVYYCDDTGMFKITNDKSYPHDIVDSIGYKHIEVIGNIYQNP